MATKTAAPREYNYKHVRAETFLEDMSFRREAPSPGDGLPHFELPTTEGTMLSSQALLRKGPLLLVTGSLTCPMTKSSAPMLNRLHSEFGDRVQMALLHVREAHPGENWDQPHTSETKIEHAHRLKERYNFTFPVLVDDPDGSVHLQLDGKPNSAWLANSEGRIVYRALWAGDETGLRQALEAASCGQRPAASGQRRSRAAGSSLP